jgi:hypothetical protein
MPKFHARAFRAYSALQIDRHAPGDSSPHHRAAEGLVASHLFGHRHHGEAERVCLHRDRASVILNGVKVDDVGVRRQFAALMQRNRGLDQSWVAPPDQVEKHCDLPLAPPVFDRAGWLRIVGSRQKRSEGDDAIVIVLEADVLFRRVADPDIPRRKINSNAERREYRQLRPTGSGFNISRSGRTARTAEKAPQAGLVEAVERLTADRMIASADRKIEFDAAVQGSGLATSPDQHAVIQANSRRNSRSG